MLRARLRKGPTRFPTLLLLFSYLLALLAVARYDREDAGLVLFLLLALSVVLLIVGMMWEESRVRWFIFLACTLSGIFILAAAAGLPVRFADHTDYRLLMLAVPAMTASVSALRKESGRPLIGKAPHPLKDWISIRASGVMLLAAATILAAADAASGGPVVWSSIVEIATMGLLVSLFGLAAPIVADHIAPEWGTGRTV